MTASDNVTDPSMVGSYFTQDTVITSGLPTTGTGKYYELLAGKGAQFAMRHATNGIDKMFVRHYINDKWYPWMEVAMAADYMRFYRADTNGDGKCDIQGEANTRFVIFGPKSICTAFFTSGYQYNGYFKIGGDAGVNISVASATGIISITGERPTSIMTYFKMPLY